MTLSRWASSFFLISLLLTNSAEATTHFGNPVSILRSYPKDFAREVSVTTQIGITASVPYSSDGTTLVVVGSLSGVHPGLIHYSVDGRTLIFNPAKPFQLNEAVSAILHATLGDESTIADTLHFQTVKEAQNYPGISGDPSSSTPAMRNVQKSPGDRALDGWLGISTILNLSPTPGNVFLAFGGIGPLNGLIILDASGNLVSIADRAGSDFEMQQMGQMTYFNGLGEYYAVDSLMNIVDSFNCTNGYTTDGHELILQSDGGYTLIGITLSNANLSSVGGPMNVQVQGNVIQSFDRNRNLVFEWRGIDYYDPSDALGVNFTGTPVDFEHANSIDIDSEGNYLLSNRNLSEVTKINGKTGAMIWRFGGRKNQFTSANDTLGISCQHDARFLPDGHITIFDNGDLHAVQESRAVEFVMDTTRMIDSMVWQFHHNPPVFSQFCGDAERLPNGNTFIGWGFPLPMPPFMTSEGTTEVQPDGTVVSDWIFAPQLMSYRAQLVPTPSAAGVTSNPMTSTTFTALPASTGGLDLAFSTQQPSQVSIALYDLMGSKIETLYDGTASSSLHTIHVPIATSSGVYYAVLSMPASRIVRPVSLIH